MLQRRDRSDRNWLLSRYEVGSLPRLLTPRSCFEGREVLAASRRRLYRPVESSLRGLGIRDMILQRQFCLWATRELLLELRPTGL